MRNKIDIKTKTYKEYISEDRGYSFDVDQALMSILYRLENPLYYDLKNIIEFVKELVKINQDKLIIKENKC